MTFIEMAITKNLDCRNLPLESHVGAVLMASFMPPLVSWYSANGRLRSLMGMSARTSYKQLHAGIYNWFAWIWFLKSMGYASLRWWCGVLGHAVVRR